MPEPSAADLRRLRALEGQLEKSAGRQREAAAKARGLSRSLTAAERRVAQLDERLSALVDVNREQAERVAALEVEAEALRKAAAGAAEAGAERDSARTEAAKERAARSALETERDRLAERIKLADAQLADGDLEPVLGAADVAHLVGRLVDQLGDGIPDLAVRDGEVHLRVAFESVGGEAGFVVPSATEAPRDIDLHDVRLRFDRRPPD